MPLCIECDCDGTLHAFTIDQRQIARHLGEPIGFVGAIPELNIFIVGIRDSTQPINKTFATHREHFHETARGTLVFIASDAEGNEIDVDQESFFRYWYRN